MAAAPWEPAQGALHPSNGFLGWELLRSALYFSAESWEGQKALVQEALDGKLSGVADCQPRINAALSALNVAVMVQVMFAGQKGIEIEHYQNGVFYGWVVRFSGEQVEEAHRRVNGSEVFGSVAIVNNERGGTHFYGFKGAEGATVGALSGGLGHLFDHVEVLSGDDLVDAFKVLGAVYGLV